MVLARHSETVEISVVRMYDRIALLRIALLLVLVYLFIFEISRIVSCSSVSLSMDAWVGRGPGRVRKGR